MSSTHQTAKKERSGGGREEQRGERREEGRWRKPWLQDGDDGKMMHIGVKTGRMDGRMIDSGQ